MRQIKFRGKRIDNGEWVYGSLVQHTDGECSIIDYADHASESYTWHDVRPESVGQFVGLLDRNGVEIYEGDIANNTTYITGSERITPGTTFAPITERGTMKWIDKEARFAFDINNSLIDEQYNGTNLYVEIIGNIYQNPDLLTKGVKA